MVDCWTCKWRRESPGSAHISCHHPSLGLDDRNPMLAFLEILGSVNRMKGMPSLGKKLNIKLSAHGVKRGWANWPFNFDPIWVEHCDGLEKEEKPFTEESDYRGGPW
jgi:hypothetical protein